MLLVTLINLKVDESKTLVVPDLPFAQFIKEIRSIEPNRDWEIFGSEVIE